MAKMILITGGQRSGKSRYAQQRALQNSPQPIYLATARHWDAEFSQRIARHQAERGPQWENLEAEKYFEDLPLQGKTVVLDCITLWLTNFFTDHQGDVEQSLQQARDAWDLLMQQDCELLVVTNEIGMGVIPEHLSARRFADLQGWMNQYLASQAEEVLLMVAGIPLKVK